MSNEGLDPRNVHHISFNYGLTKRNPRNLSIGILKLQFLFEIEKLSTKLLIVAFVSIFSGFYSFFLLERTGLYSLGINSFFQAIARCVRYFMDKGSHPSDGVYSVLFWGMTLLLNIPLAIIGYKKVGSNFTILSIFAICISSLTAIILSSLQEKWGFKDFYIFSDPRTFNECLKSKKINILQWNYVSIISNGKNGQATNVALNDSSNVALIFFYGFIFGLLNTFTSLIIYALGGSTGGIDWLIFYLSKKKMHSTSNIFLYTGLIITFLSYLIGTYIPYANHMFGANHQCSSTTNSSVSITGALNANNTNLVFSNMFGPMLFATNIAAFTKRIIFNFFYPHFKLINVRIFTNKSWELRKLLLSSNFPHSFTINNALGGYLLRRQNVFEIICFALELKTLMEHTRKIDPYCLIVATPIKSLSGNFIVRDNLN